MLGLILTASLTAIICGIEAEMKSGSGRLRKATAESSGALMCPLNYAVHKINLDKAVVFCFKLNETGNAREEEQCTWKRNCDLYNDPAKNKKLSVDWLTNNTRIPRGARIKRDYVEFYCCKEKCRYATCRREKTTERKLWLIVPTDGVPRFVVKASFSPKNTDIPAVFTSCKILCSGGGPALPGGHSGVIPLVITPCTADPYECDTTPKMDFCACEAHNECKSGGCSQVADACLPKCTIDGEPTCPYGKCIEDEIDKAYCHCSEIGVTLEAEQVCCSGTAEGTTCVPPATCSSTIECLPGVCSCGICELESDDGDDK